VAAAKIIAFPSVSPRMSEGGKERPGLALVVGAAAASDDELLAQFLEGREAAFGALVRRHEATARAVARRWVADPDDLLDLVQRAFLRALQSWRRARALRILPVPPFRPLLLRATLNLARNQARDASRWRKAPLEALDGAADVPAVGTARLEREERARALRREVARLPRRQREVLLLRIDGELPFTEVAAALGITENSAKVSFHHAARRLAELLREEER